MADDLFADIPEGDGLFDDIPVPKGRPGVRAALSAIIAERKRLPKRTSLDLASERAANSFTLGLSNQFNAGANALLNQSDKYSLRDRYDAQRLLAKAEQQRFSARRPLVAAASDITGAVAMPGGKQVAKFVVGKVAPKAVAAGRAVPASERVLQTARLSATGGALTGVQAGALANPGEEVKDATAGAVTGAVLAPAAGLAIGAVSPVLRGTGRTLARVVGRGPSAEITSVEKLQKALQQAGVTPDALEVASARWNEVGGVDPTLIDLIKDAGGSSEVLRLLSKSASRAPVRRASVANVEEKTAVAANREAFATEELAADAEAARRAAEIARRGETKATTVERRGTHALSQIDRTEADRLAQIEAARIAETPEPPAPPRPREAGAAAFADDLNRRYDISEKTYKEAYAAAEAAKPEAALVDDAEVRPLFAKLEVPQTFDEALPGVAAVKKYIAGKKNLIAPGDANDWPEGEVMELPTPLTMLELQKMRQVLTHYASKYADDPGGALAARMKTTLDAEIDRLAAENKITGDPKIVEKWKTAIGGAREHFTNFGSGLPAKITARNPDGSRVVPSHQAGDVIFGAPGQISMNKSLTDLEGSLDLVSPESVRALQEELYGRVSIGDLSKLRETTGGRRLLPEDLTAEALAAREAAQAAEARAAEATDATKETTKALRETTAAGAEARKAQVDLNTAARADAAAAEAAARREPLAALTQSRVDQATTQAKNAQELNRAVQGPSAKGTDPLIENVSGGDVAYKSGRIEQVLDFLRRGRHLNEREYEAAFKTLISKDPEAKSRLMNNLLKKYPAAKRALAPFVVRPAAQGGDEQAVEVLEEDYGLTP